MRVGVNILNFGPGASPAATARWAAVAEALGYHSDWISDHVADTPGVAGRYPEPFFDTFTTLAWLASQTHRVQLGTTVCVLPYRHPLLIARLVANIDRLSGGRFVFGVGVGNAEDEFRALGVAFERRGAIANESLRAMKALWAAEALVSFAGRHFAFADVAPMRPLQAPHPPLWVGGASDAALTRAVRLGDAWHPILRSLPGFETGIETLRRLSDAAGRAPPALCPRIRLDLRAAAVDGERLPGSGSLEQVRDDLGAIERLGGQHVVLDWHTGDLEATPDHARGWQMLATLAQQVLDLEREAVR